ncbi:MAG TPA: LysM peptidoglycan-binding domain-containing protein, partial [Caldilinea sp.]|nr:LysM peptidoglycan-binding domain-containing protein [Caldilinea sp.]
EWLLRSSQARQRVPADGRRIQEDAPLSDAELLPVSMEEVRPSPAARRSAMPGAITALGMVILLALGGWWLWSNPPVWLTAMLPVTPSAAPVTVEDAPAVKAPASAPARTGEITTENATSGEGEPAPTPTSQPTPAVAPDLAQQSEPLAAASPQAIIVAPPFDLKTVLIEAQRPELAETVNGRREGTRLVLEGTAPSVEARDDLAALLVRLPGIEEVSVVNVLVRPPSTYTVVEGDTLWGISMKLYGNPDRIQALFEANQDALPSSDALRVGMELQVPPAE